MSLFSLSCLPSLLLSSISSPTSLALLLALLSPFSRTPLSLAQYPPGSNLTTVPSPVDGSITVSFKTPPKGTCETVFDTQQQYTGWVNIPGRYPSNIFFWFIAARSPTDQLAIWLNGGPGSSSMIGLFAENGPCEVVDAGRGKFETRAREWGWDRGANMLYIDQPNQVGFSYDTPTKASVDLLTSNIYAPPQVLPNSQPATTFLNGTFSSLNENSTVNTTESAGMIVWHMMQGFLGAFPKYTNSSTMRVHLFAESYGGKYGPAFARQWEDQNQKRLNGTISPIGTLEIKLASLGIINGCIDDLIQTAYYPVMAVNNTYGLTTINPTRARLAAGSFSAPGGCQELITACRAAVAAQDPDDVGDVAVVNSACSNAQSSCANNVMNAYLDAGRSVYDIAHILPESFPPSNYLEYLNTAEFLSAIGSPVNFTQTNRQVIDAFISTGDYVRQSLVPDLVSLLNSGVRVGLVYGDRDYICNWFGGEAISLAVAAHASPAYATRFPAAGYAPIIVNTTYIGGVVRQFGNLSFSRIYDAGHSVPAYQPETAFQVFARIITGTSLSTGAMISLSSYNTSGPLNSTATNTLPASPAATCYLRDIQGSCSDDQKHNIIKGQGIIINGVLYNSFDDYIAGLSEESTTTISGSVTVTTTTEVLTGFFTATSTPNPTKKSFAIKDSPLKALLSALLVVVFL